MIIFYIFMLIAGVGLVIWGVKLWRRNTVRENIWDSILSIFMGGFDSTLGMILFGLLLIFLGIMKLIYGINWGIDQ